MVPQGPPTPLGGSQPVPPSLLRSNSGLLGGQGGGMPSQNAFPSLVSPRNQFSNLNNMLGNNSNVSSLLHQSSFGNGGSSSVPGSGPEPSPLGNGMGFSNNNNNNNQSSSYISSSIAANPNSSGQVQGQQQFSNPMLNDQQQSHQLDPNNFQHNNNNNNNQQQQQFQAMRAGLGGAGPVKMEPQTTNEQTPQQQLQNLRNMGSDNNIEFWRKFVAEYFAPNAKKKWCVSMYGSGRQTTGVFPQDVWHCEICNRKPGRGFEATVEVLPRLFKIKYESGTLEELLYVDMPREYQNPSGQIVLDYAKAIQESVFEQLRVVRDGQLRIVFSPDLKICSWEFCARRHEELIPRRLLVPQVSQLGTAAQKYQAATQSTSPSVSVSELQNNCNMFVASARQLAKALEVPLVNDLGYTKRYVRCLQISEVVNSMKDLIDYSRETGSGPMESLTKFPRRTNSSPSFRGQSQQSESQHQQQQQQTTGQNSSNDNSAQPASMQLASTNANTTMNSGPTTSSNNTIANLLHQNSMNSHRPQNPISNMNASYGGNSVQMPSPGGSSNTMPHTNNNPSPSPFQSPTPSSSNNNNNPQSHATTANSPNISMQQQQQPALSNEVDASDSQSSVQKIIHDMMMSSQLGGDVKNVNGVLSNNARINGGNILVGTGVSNGNISNNIGVSGFGGIQNGLGQSAMVNGIRAALGNNNNNSLSMNGRVGMMGREQGMMMMSSQQQQQQDMSNQLLTSLGAVNGFNNLQFDWKTSP
ncbi:transcriptional corepressor seuss [Phtheirospermum japonicum]|uniref:Transcriptional corepressor seuss n=1 Tax=Phtheirospermum japonicum TaxID=374723 RepID=A0A830B6H3_9LAMI|nr:transcriptional corepressor seuss [Phtheirospermum japonicum]